MISMVVAAYKNRKHATYDVTSAYLHADMDDFVVIKIQGQIVDILCAKIPCYKEFVVMENGKRMLYMQLLKLFASFAIICILRSEFEYIFAISSTCEANANISSRVQIMRNKANANILRQILAILKRRPTPAHCTTADLNCCSCQSG